MTLKAASLSPRRQMKRETWSRTLTVDSCEIAESPHCPVLRLWCLRLGKKAQDRFEWPVSEEHFLRNWHSSEVSECSMEVSVAMNKQQHSARNTCSLCCGGCRCPSYRWLWPFCFEPPLGKVRRTSTLLLHPTSCAPTHRKRCNSPQFRQRLNPAAGFKVILTLTAIQINVRQITGRRIFQCNFISRNAIKMNWSKQGRFSQKNKEAGNRRTYLKTLTYSLCISLGLRYFTSATFPCKQAEVLQKCNKDQNARWKKMR